MDQERYERQTSFRHLSRKDQKRLEGCKVTIIGMGALGSVTSELLARAGIGKLVIVDRDYVEKSNLQRQLLFDENDIGQAKSDASREKLSRINSEMEIESKVCDAGPDNIEDLVFGSDLVMDCSDNMETRFLINDCCMKARKPWIYIGALGSVGATMNFVAIDNPCFRCIFKDAPQGSIDTTETSGILNTTIASVSSLAVTQAIKILTGKDYSRDMIYIDIWNQRIDRMKIKRLPDCPACCGKYEYLEMIVPEQKYKIKMLSSKSFQLTPHDKRDIDLDNLFQKLQQEGKTSIFGHVLHLTTDGKDISIFSDGRMIVKDAKDKEQVRSLYELYVGR